MAFGDRIKARREELALSRPQLADRLGVTPSTVSNYETGVSFPKEEMMLRLFDCLETDPNTLFQDSFRRGADVLTERERQLLEPIREIIGRILGADPSSLEIVNRPPTRSKPLYMKVWEARKADGLDYDPEDERQQHFLAEITKYNLRSID